MSVTIVKELYANGAKRIYGSVNGQYSGLYRDWYSNGKCATLQNFVNGILNGEQKVWHKNGQLKSIKKFENGNMHGEQNEWDENGKHVMSVLYQNNHRVGSDRISHSLEFYLPNAMMPNYTSKSNTMQMSYPMYPIYYY
jgi:antitoxin component YwqK of YwqJK toxin-antitoxin module